MQIKEVCKLPQISCMKIRIEFLGFYLGDRINEKLSMRAREKIHIKLHLLFLEGSYTLFVSKPILGFG